MAFVFFCTVQTTELGRTLRERILLVFGGFPFHALISFFMVSWLTKPTSKPFKNLLSTHPSKPFKSISSWQFTIEI